MIYHERADFERYEYWKRLSSADGDIGLPIRVAIITGGIPVGAETINPETGRMVLRMTLLGDIRRDERVEEIDEAEFNRLCETHIAAYQKKTAKPESGPGGMG